jgi:urease accessory protein
VKHIVAAEPTAQLDLSFVRRGDRTVIDRRLFRWPFVLTRSFPGRMPVPHMLSVIVQTSSGAVHGEDQLAQRLHVGAGAAVHLTNQGATAVHRADGGRTTNENVHLSVEPGAALEYMPEPRILFPGAALSQRLELNVAADGSAIVADAFTMHDPAGTGLSFRAFESTVTIGRGGDDELLIDRMHIGAQRPHSFLSHRAFGSVLMVLPDHCDAGKLAHSVAEGLAQYPGLYAAASLLPANLGVGVRLAAAELRLIRQGIAEALRRFQEFGVSDDCDAELSLDAETSMPDVGQ